MTQAQINAPADNAVALSPTTDARNRVVSMSPTIRALTLRNHATQSAPMFALENAAGATTAHFKHEGQLQINLAGTPVVSDPTYGVSIQNTGSIYSWLEILNNGGTNKGCFFGMEGDGFHQYNWQGGAWGIWTSTSASDGNLRIYATADGNISFNGGKWSHAIGWGGGVGVIVINNCTTVPTSDVTAGGILYVEDDALTYRSARGTITVIGPA